MKKLLIGSVIVLILVLAGCGSSKNIAEKLNDGGYFYQDGEKLTALKFEVKDSDSDSNNPVNIGQVYIYKESPNSDGTINEIKVNYLVTLYKNDEVSFDNMRGAFKGKNLIFKDSTIDEEHTYEQIDEETLEKYIKNPNTDEYTPH